MAIIPKITNDNVENFENAVEIWTSMGKVGNFIGIYDTRRNFYHEEKGGCYTDDNHFRITNNLSGKEDVIVMDVDSAINYCINLGEQGGLENFRTICSILWSNNNMGRYYLERKGCADRGSENLAILLYLCGQGVISRVDLANEIMMHSKATECPHIFEKGL